MPEPLLYPDGLKIVDSHTEGEPTRTIIAGFPELRGETLIDMRDDFAARFDHLRTALICEPRGYDAVVGALIVWDGPRPRGVIYFNDAGYLGMCGHGTIGVAETLRYLGVAKEGTLTLETPAGPVDAKFESGSREITIRNVPSYRHDGATVFYGQDIEGEIAYGGNWFWLQEVRPEFLRADRLDELMNVSKAIRAELRRQGVTGKDGAEIDHVEFFAYQEGGSKNFVLCPGNAYDRSPCGTGTSAKVACLAHHGMLAPGEVWRNESVTGGVFHATYEVVDGQIVPSITGRAFITGRFEPVFDGERA